jgi:hypothetical protein
MTTTMEPVKWSSENIDANEIPWHTLSRESWRTLDEIVAPLTDGYLEHEVARALRIPRKAVEDRLAALRSEIVQLASQSLP